ncbi:MAG: hypothetical protein GC159_02040 [Phycisphaera sp.]|nr:hypothetical protein [Phycisphaera sp.]
MMRLFAMKVSTGVMILGVLIGSAMVADTARADPRRFGYSYETTTMPKGAWEYEQWVTWKTSKAEDRNFDRIDFRHEVEYGLADNWQVAFYLSDWRYEHGDSVEDDGTSWQNVALETIYSITNPVTDPIGSAVYGEVRIGEHEVGVEGKLLLQKDIGPWSIVWNGILEAEWEGEEFGDYDERAGELAQTFGVSYQIVPQLTAGFELLHEIGIDEWEEFGDHVVYVGPNVSYRGKGWFITVTPLFQVTDLADEADFETRFLFGIEF